ncbi:MAG TPA: glycosyltransferase [Thermoanaerobaculia bacterium]|nr:glycosyltransferase [Thermoanaerobaculia bacterium]
MTEEISGPPVEGARPPHPPRVALVHDWLTGMRGGEKVLEAICALFPGAPIYTLFHFPGSVSAAIESHPIVTSFLNRAPGIRRRYRHYLPLFPAAIEDFDLSGFDLIVSSSHCVAKGVIPPPGAFHLCYCYTPMRYAWDQEHAYFPRRTGLVARLRGLALSRLRAWDVAATPRVDRFVADSEFVAERIRRYYSRAAEVLAPPVDLDFFTPGPAPEPARPYALAVSALAPYKRVDIAIAACARSGLPLRIVGEGPERKRLLHLAAASGTGVEFLGRVGGEELRDLYRGATLFVQPGIEDFGISAVEALACGTPVVAAGRGGILDIVESGRDGLLYEPLGGTPEQAGRMSETIDKARQFRFNPLEIRQRAERFSSHRFAERLRALCLPIEALPRETAL